MIDCLIGSHGFLAGALNAGKPIEEPQTDRAGQIENGFADFSLKLS